MEEEFKNKLAELQASPNTSSSEDELGKQVEMLLFSRAWFHFRLILIQNKLSFAAFSQNMTVKELFLRAIIFSF